MNLLSILTEKDANKVQEKIQLILESFYDEGIDIEERIYYIKPFYCLNYSVSIENIKDYPINDFINIFKLCASNAIYEYIKDYEKPGLIQHIINTDYSCFSLEERMGIYKDCLDMLDEKNTNRFLLGDDIFDSKLGILQQLTDYLKDNTEINLSGFILFRLQDCLLDLNKIIETAVEDFLIDKEYNEFIKLLKYFVDVQESKFEIVHVVFDRETGFKIYDQHNELLNNDYIENVAVELSENDIDQDDLLISALITIAPERIIIHKSPKDTDVIRTLQEIFSEKIHFCDGCEWCNVRANVNKE
ncbi:MAG TPA: putative sporulation protein YtxC [Oscillospiraceae bacterium]|nr:putative sporulation protein YtxC [Oscillospiraceae bacterium]